VSENMWGSDVYGAAIDPDGGYPDRTLLRIYGALAQSERGHLRGLAGLQPARHRAMA
jgi:hypothetical protein